jgi:hypothetical protein
MRFLRVTIDRERENNRRRRSGSELPCAEVSKIISIKPIDVIELLDGNLFINHADYGYVVGVFLSSDSSED